MKECLIYGILGGFIGSLYMGWLISSKSPYSKYPSLAIVDMQVLISKKSQQLSKEFLLKALDAEGKLMNIEATPIRITIQEVADQLKDDLNTFAATHNLILLTKATVVSGDVPDKTGEILAMLEKDENP